MDPEQTFLRVHARLSGVLSQLLTPRIRMALEYIYLVVAVALFCLLVIMHTNFVQQPGCSSELSGIEFTEAQLVQIKITSGGLWAHNAADQNMVAFQNQESSTESSKTSEVTLDGFRISAAKFWSNWIGSSARRNKLIFKSWKSLKEFLEPQLESAADTSVIKKISDEQEIRADTQELHVGIPESTRESSKTAGWDAFLDIIKCLQMLRLEHLNSFVVQWLEKRSKALEPTYLYTVEKGYFLLPEGAKSRHNVKTVNLTISSQNPCFGNRWQQLLINSLVGYDTILMNTLLSSPGQGYLYNFQTKEFYDLSYRHEPSGGPAGFGDYFVTKCGVLIMSLFVFFTTTMSVSFTLRETQSRMLKFTVQLQHHARHQLPTFRLIFVHVIESLVFVPIMTGILFFLFEFYDDQLLAFLVLILVWLCEVFTMISVRTPISMQFFPRFFLLYFLLFHIYFFSYGYGFSYLAFSATAAFMQHLILYFWNRFEIPALRRFIRSRSQLQQRARVQITSSIVTSTLHFARVNMRNTSVVNNELGTGPEILSGPDHVQPDSTEAAESTGTREQSASGSPDSISNPLQFPDLNPQQTETAPSSLNLFSSFLLWILGGTSSDGIGSFFSMFRDFRDHGQVYAAPPQPENEPIT